MLVLFVVVVPVLILMIAFVVDVPKAYVENRHLQGVADAAALAGAQDISPTCTGACAGAAAMDYSARNGGPLTLDQCDGAHPTNCYASPYVDKLGNVHADKIEVRIRTCNAGFFGGMTGVPCFRVGARAVGTQSTGPPPAITFAALNRTAGKHTLLIKSSGKLTVQNNIYVNSLNDDDGFDIKGTSGSITAPQVFTVGGWEKSTDTSLTLGGIACPIDTAFPGTPAPPGCPLTGQPPIEDPFLGKVSPPSLGAPACTSTIKTGNAAEYSPQQDLKADITATDTTLTTTDPNVIQTGDYIQIENEIMLVTLGGGSTVTVQRGQLGTTAAKHAKGKAIKKVPVGVGGTAAVPAPCTVTSGTRVLSPGTYYGGICIGASDCTANNCKADATQPPAIVTFASGTYIMAGGGLKVCGSSTLSAPASMIYNTNDPSHPAGAGALGQILLNTTGVVTLGPPATGSYAGLTIFQDLAQALAPATKCDGRPENQMDVLFKQTANGLNGISGTIYAGHQDAMFSDAISGTATLAVIAGCIFIDGATSTFNFDTSGGLFGVATALEE